MRFTNKTALITGGNSGIGLAAARLFLAEGARVAITGRNQKTLRAAAAELGESVLTIQADVTDVEATERAVAAAVRYYTCRPDVTSRFRRDHPNELDCGVLHRASRRGASE